LLSWILIIFATVVMDQVTKLMAVKLLAPVKSVDVIPGVFRFTYVENEGAAFGMFSDHRWIFMVISTVAIIALLVYLLKFPPDSKLACTALSFIIGGGIGNMIDRVCLGYVVDLFDFCAFPNIWMWVFNVADAFVCVGGGMLMLWLVLSIINDAKLQKAKKTVNDETTGTEGFGDK